MSGSGWIRLEDLKEVVCKHQEPFVQVCGKASSCVLCAAFANFKTFFQEARASALKCEQSILGFLSDPQSKYRNPDLREEGKCITSPPPTHCSTRRS